MTVFKGPESGTITTKISVSSVNLIPFLLSDEPDLVVGQPVHQAAVVDVALPDDHIRHV